MIEKRLQNKKHVHSLIRNKNMLTVVIDFCKISKEKQMFENTKTKTFLNEELHLMLKYEAI